MFSKPKKKMDSSKKVDKNDQGRNIAVGKALADEFKELTSSHKIYHDFFEKLYHSREANSYWNEVYNLAKATHSEDVFDFFANYLELLNNPTAVQWAEFNNKWIESNDVNVVHKTRQLLLKLNDSTSKLEGTIDFNSIRIIPEASITPKYDLWEDSEVKSTSSSRKSSSKKGSNEKSPVISKKINAPTSYTGKEVLDIAVNEVLTLISLEKSQLIINVLKGNPAEENDHIAGSKSSIKTSK